MGASRDRRRGPRLDIPDQVVDGIGEPGGGHRHVDDAGQVVAGDGGKRGPQAQRNRSHRGRTRPSSGADGRLLDSGREAPAMAHARSRAGLVRTRSGFASIIEINLGHAPPGSAPIATRSAMDDLCSFVRYQDLESARFCRGMRHRPSVGHERQRMPGRIVAVCHFESPGLSSISVSGTSPQRARHCHGHRLGRGRACRRPAAPELAIKVPARGLGAPRRFRVGGDRVPPSSRFTIGVDGGGCWFRRPIDGPSRAPSTQRTVVWPMRGHPPKGSSAYITRCFSPTTGFRRGPLLRRGPGPGARCGKWEPG